MNFMVLPPEVNSARIYAGAGPAPMLAAAVAWDGLAAELGMAAASFSLLISGLTAGPGSAWQGPAAAATGRGRTVSELAERGDGTR